MEGGFSFLGAIILFLIIQVFFSMIVRRTSGSPNALVIVNFVAGLVIQLAFFAAAFLPAKVLGSRLTYTFAKPTLRSCLLAPLIAVICVIGFEGLALAFNMTLIGHGYVDTSSIAMSGGLVIAFTVIRAVLVAPVCEEALLRGSVLSSLGVCGAFRERLRVPFMIVACGLLFAVMHMNPMQTVYQFFLGCTLAYVTIRFGNIVPAIIIHAVNNLIGVVVALPAINDGVTGLMTDIYGTGWFALFVGVSVLLAAGALLLVRVLCRRFGGQTPLSPDKEKREGGGFVNSADDGGTLAGVILTSVGAVICVAMWIANLAGGFGAL